MRVKEVLAGSPHTVERLRTAARDSEHCVLIADGSGLVVEQYSDSRSALQLKDAGLACGTMWRESEAGTNAIAIALQEHTVATVSGADHFLEAFTQFTCTASPVLDQDGAVLAVVDLTTGKHDEPSGQAFARHLLACTTAEIQAAHFRWSFRDLLVISLVTQDTALCSEAALLAVSSGGLIEAATLKAARFVGAESRATLLGRHIDDAIDIRLSALLQGAGQRLPVESVSGTRGFAIPVAPVDTVSRRHRSVTSEPRSHATTESSVRVHGAMADPRPGLQELAGSDPVMLGHVDLCEKILDRGIPIMLQGETGTGKDAFARALHAASSRADQPFVPMDCAATPASLLDSELFGYAPGTFTGGLKNGKIGKVAASDGGTLFLDEIGDMPVELQASLLRVLAEGQVTPLGATTPIDVDLHIVCATHRDLATLVAAGHFRSDLYYRLNGARIELPPLRERRDLEDLIAKILSDEGDPPPALSEEALKVLRSYHWPGNIRQLINSLRLAAACCSDGVIARRDLPEDLRAARAAHSGVAAEAGTGHAPPQEMETESSRQVDRERLIDALEATGWNVSGAARLLRISRSTAHRRISSLGIVRPR